MYCYNCGVNIAGDAARCPLCGADLGERRPAGNAAGLEPFYPENKYPPAPLPRRAPLFAVTLLFLLAALLTMLLNYQLSGCISWSGFVAGALAAGYPIFVLPFWFRRPNPVIFVPCGFAAAGLYLLYIDLATGGSWFLSLAFPMVGALGTIATAVAALLRYLRRGKLYVYGGALILLGLYAFLAENLINLTFGLPRLLLWSLYPLTALSAAGMLLIFLAICRPAREAVHRKTFI